ncbi:MAG TPA: Ig-like domain-containing protein, partial [Candidatus Acidoferrum sp.]|nr:Ig-like domain-containing protein [Candidatus Acidoferrum sp.]
VPGSFRWDGDTTLIFTPNDRLPFDTQFLVQIAAGFEDSAGNATTAPTDAWTFRTVGLPLVTGASPAGTDPVPVDTTVVLTFDRLMATTSVEQAVRVSPNVAYRASWSQRVLTLTFANDLAFGTTYTISVGTGATDTDGAHLAQPFNVRFTTVAAGVAILATTPADGASGVSVRGPITVAFDTPIDPGSLAGSLEITPPVGGSFSVVATPSDAAIPSPSPSESPSEAPPGKVLLFTPDGALAAHTTYTVTLRPVIHRLASPEQVAAGETWTFTTGQPATSAQNQVLFLTARSGIRNLWMMNPDGTNPRQVTAELAPVSGYDVTVDGGLIAIGSGGVVRVLRVDGSDERTVTGAGRYEYAPVFTPDGHSLIVARRSADGTDLGYWLEPVPGVGSGGERRILVDGAPPIGSAARTDEGIEQIGATGSWSGRIAFAGTSGTVLIAGGDGSLRIVELGHPEQAPLPVPVSSSTAPFWSAADDAFLVVGAGSDGRSALWTVRRDGTANRVTDAAGPAVGDGRRAVAVLQSAFHGSGEPLHAAFLTNPGAVPTLLTTAADLSDRTPVFSPNGQEILFVRVPTAQPDTPAGIWVVATDGANLRQLTRDGADPRWLP